MIDIQYSITIMGGREVSRPYRVWFFAEGEQCFPLNRDYAALKKAPY